MEDVPSLARSSALRGRSSPCSCRAAASPSLWKASFSWCFSISDDLRRALLPMQLSSICSHGIGYSSHSFGVTAVSVHVKSLQPENTCIRFFEGDSQCFLITTKPWKSSSANVY